MKAADRKIIFEKCGGRCAYCGGELTGKWHVDHASPIHRTKKLIGGEFLTLDTKTPPTEQDFINGNYSRAEQKLVAGNPKNPQNDCIENMLPACPSCNLYKHSGDVEGFRIHLGKIINSLNRDSTMYKFGKRFGLINETPKPIVFYFETLIPQ